MVKSMANYSFDEAVEEVLKFRERIGGTMPEKYDYEKYGIDVEGLAHALGAEESMKRLGTSAYSAVNMTVIKELRRRNGEPINIR